MISTYLKFKQSICNIKDYQDYENVRRALFVLNSTVFNNFDEYLELRTLLAKKLNQIKHDSGDTEHEFYDDLIFEE